MQPMVKHVENEESVNAYRYVDPNPLGNIIAVETSYGISKRQYLAGMLIAGSGLNLVATQLAVDRAYAVADLILAGPTSGKSVDRKSVV